MKKTTIALALVVAAIAGAAGYLWGSRQHEETKPVAVKAERKILYYRNPMGEDTSPTPKKDPMGMDYVPVYEGEAEDKEGFSVSVEKQQKLGVVTEPAARRRLVRALRLTAVIQVNERAQYTVTPRFEGWVQQLHVNATGQTVRAGQPLLTVYSPDLLSALGEYRAAQSAGLLDLMKSARQRLNNWQITEEDLAHLEHGQANLELRSPINGVVLEKPAINGMRFGAGDVLFKLADLSTVWVEAQVPEDQQGLLQLGQKAQVTVDAYPGEMFAGKVSFIYPTLDPQTRTVKVRVELPNRGGRLRPAMFAQVELAAPLAKEAVLSIPVSAVIDSGTRQVALVRVADDRFQPRELKLGQRTADYVEVLEGVSEGEQVVTRANFLLDSESNLKSALGGPSHQHGTEAAPEAPSKAPEPGTHENMPGMKMENSTDMTPRESGEHQHAQ